MSSGPFSTLDNDTTLAVLTLLPLRDVLNALAVCKGMRTLRRHPGLWTVLNLNMLDESCTPWMSEGGVTRLFEWLPPSTTELSIKSNDLSADRLVKLCLHSKVLTKLALHCPGPKVGPKLLSSVLKAHGGRLTDLSIHEASGLEKTKLALLALVGGTPLLRRLTLHPRTLGYREGLSFEALQHVQQAITTARLGGKSLITHLALPVDMLCISALSATFPELKELRLHNVSVPMIREGMVDDVLAELEPDDSDSDSEAGFNETLTLVINGKNFDVEPLAQLQRLSVIYDHWYDTLGPSPTAVYATLNALLRACPPSLRHLSLSTGARVTRRKAGEAIDEADQEFRLKALKYRLPSLTDLLSDAASLESLQVNGFWLADADSLAGLASLRSLSLVACRGPGVLPSLVSAARASPLLRTLNMESCMVTLGENQEGDDVAAKLSDLPAGQLTALRLSRCGGQLPAALRGAAAAGCLSAVSNLQLIAPTTHPESGNMYNGNVEKSLFVASSPLPALVSLTVKDVDVPAASWRASLRAPQLRNLTLVANRAKKRISKGEVTRDEAAWEAIRAETEAALVQGGSCINAAVQVMDRRLWVEAAVWAAEALTDQQEGEA